MAVVDKKTHARLIARAWEDDDFKARLLKEPQKVLKEEGIKVPRGVKVKAVANDSKTVHIVVPAKPKKKLTESQIAKQKMAPMMTCF